MRTAEEWAKKLGIKEGEFVWDLQVASIRAIQKDALCSIGFAIAAGMDKLRERMEDLMPDLSDEDAEQFE